MMKGAERSNLGNRRGHAGTGLLAVTLALVLTALLGGCASNAAKTSPERTIQSGTLDGYEDKTVEEAFDTFFSDPSWKHTEGENGAVQAVLFTGVCQLDDEEETAVVSFEFDKDDWSQFHVESIEIGTDSIVTQDDLDAFLDVIYGRKDEAALTGLVDTDLVNEAAQAATEAATEAETDEGEEAETEMTETAESDTTAQQEDSCILPESNSRYYDYDELLGMSVDELNLAIDEIYARHGRMFKDGVIQAYFDRQSWYKPKYEPDQFDAISDSLLNDYEKENAATLAQVRDDTQSGVYDETALNSQYTQDELESMAFNYYMSQYPSAQILPKFGQVSETEDAGIYEVELGFENGVYDIHYLIDATTGEGKNLDNGDSVDFSQYLN